MRTLAENIALYLGVNEQITSWSREGWGDWGALVDLSSETCRTLSDAIMSDVGDDLTTWGFSAEDVTVELLFMVDEDNHDAPLTETALYVRQDEQGNVRYWVGDRQSLLMMFQEDAHGAESLDRENDED